jgi:hypothetical protein
MPRRLRLALAAGLTLACPASAQQPFRPVEHRYAAPLVDRASPQELAILADQGLAIEHDRPPAQALAEHRRLDATLKSLQPQRPGVVDAYVLSVGLDSDPVFGTRSAGSRTRPDPPLRRDRPIGDAGRQRWSGGIGAADGFARQHRGGARADRRADGRARGRAGALHHQPRRTVRHSL